MWKVVGNGQLLLEGLVSPMTLDEVAQTDRRRSAPGQRLVAVGGCT